ncbi:MAG: hypothetical protein IT168_26415 [Bryobacterales bacterium]|nr:hypothetical protein [Bryobacterales bacterium]
MSRTRCQGSRQGADSETKTAIRRAAGENGLDLGGERVSLWCENGTGFEYFTRTRTIYLAFQAADHYQEEIFVFGATDGSEALTLLTLPPAGPQD